MLRVMERQPLRSRAVVSAGYDAATRALDIEFSSGRVYRFSDVPASVFEWLLRVPNKGVYIARTITGHYAYADVTGSPSGDDAPDLATLLERSLPDAGDGA